MESPARRGWSRMLLPPLVKPQARPAPGDLTVGGRLAEWDGLDYLPDPRLESCGRHVERKVECEMLPVKVFRERTSPLFHRLVIPAQDCVRIVLRKRALDKSI